MIPELGPHLGSLREAAHAEPLGLYLHIPFCVDRCTYCSFVTTRDHAFKPAALERLEQDLRAWGTLLERPALDTLYLGGGTPSILTLDELAALTAAARTAFDCSPLREATLEANPGTVDRAWLAGACGLGWDRISLGVQTLDDRLLRCLGRIHDAPAGLAALRDARAAGFERISADLMIGIPGQDLERLLADARRLAAAGANHLSIYMLDLDKACPLKVEVDAGRLALPSDETVAEAFEALQTELPALGFTPYEISNYAMTGQVSRHNTRYWERRPYLGLGPSAASHLGRWRWTESGSLPAWTEGRGSAECQELTSAEALAEFPLMGLRMLRGVDWEALRTRASGLELLPLVEQWEGQLEPFFRHGLLVREGPILRFLPKGLLLSNAVLEIFV